MASKGGAGVHHDAFQLVHLRLRRRRRGRTILRGQQHAIVGLAWWGGRERPTPGQTPVTKQLHG